MVNGSGRKLVQTRHRVPAATNPAGMQHLRDHRASTPPALPAAVNDVGHPPSRAQNRIIVGSRSHLTP
jgi:hypothetical protein